MAKNNKAGKLGTETLLPRFPGFFASALKSAVTLFIHSIGRRGKFASTIILRMMMNIIKKKLNNYIYISFILRNEKLINKLSVVSGPDPRVISIEKFDE